MADIKIEYKRFKFDKHERVYKKSDVEELNKNPDYQDFMGDMYVGGGKSTLCEIPIYKVMGQEAIPNLDSGEVDKVYIIKNINDEKSELEYVVEEFLFSTPMFNFNNITTIDNITPFIIEAVRYNIETYEWSYDAREYGNTKTPSRYGNIPEEMLGWWKGNTQEEVAQECGVDCGVLDGDSMINHPSHYNQYRIEVIDIIEDATKDINGIEAVCIANVLKYVLRYKYKNGIEDLKKARFYLDKVIDNLANKEK